MPRPIADCNLPVSVLPCYTCFSTHHFVLFFVLTFIKKKYTH